MRSRADATEEATVNSEQVAPSDQPSCTVGETRIASSGIRDKADRLMSEDQAVVGPCSYDTSVVVYDPAKHSKDGLPTCVTCDHRFHSFHALAEHINRKYCTVMFPVS